MSGSLVSGVADVKFIGNALYALEAGAGPSHGLAGTTNGIYRITPAQDGRPGSAQLVADLSAFQRAHPTVSPAGAPASAATLPDFEPDGTWYSMVAVRGTLYAVEPNHGELDRITTDGQISRVSDIYSSQGHVVPTSLAYHGNFYVGNLGQFGPDHQPENVYKVTPSGQIQVVASGLSEVLGVAFDAQGRLYVLQSSTGGVAPIPGTGDIIRFNEDGSQTLIADHLVVPTAMAFGPDGALYVSNLGFGAPPVGLGQVLRIDLTGDVPASSDFAALTLRPAGEPSDPTAFAYTGQSVSTTQSGTQLFGVGSGALHLGANGAAPFTTTAHVSISRAQGLDAALLGEWLSLSGSERKR